MSTTVFISSVTYISRNHTKVCVSFMKFTVGNKI